MKIQKNYFVSGAQMLRSAFFTLILTGMVLQSEAQITNIVKSGTGFNSSVGFDPNAGLINWYFNGVNQLSQETIYYNVGVGIQQLNSANLTSYHTVKNGSTYNKLIADYDLGNGNTLDLTYTLSASVNGASLLYNMQLFNGSGNPENVSLFQYSVANLPPGPQTMQMSVTTPGSQYLAMQYGNGGASSLQDQWQPTGQTSTEMLADGGPPTGSLPPNGMLNGSTSFTFESDAASLAGGNGFNVSGTQYLTVPEPSSLALMASGMLGLALLYRRRQGGQRHCRSC
jgi:PEP-CTERM motif